MEKTTIKQLKKLGLNNSEIKIYTYLLEYGVSTPTIISKKTLILRPNCYSVLDNLERMGIVNWRISYSHTSLQSD